MRLLPELFRELSAAFNDARDDANIGVVVLTGKGDLAFLLRW
jgi:1,4-dihydroxy-2-naphthoyl-CoA synthase